MIQYLYDTLGIEASLVNFSDKNKLPFYLIENYHFSVLRILEQDFIYLEVIDKLPSTGNIKKHMETIYKKCNMSCVIGIKKISSYQRKRLIEERIPFIVPYNQLFLPSLGVSLTEKTNKELIVAPFELFSPATQVLFLFLLYSKNLSIINPTDAAKKLNFSKMTMTRAFAELQNLGLVTAKSEGTKRLFSVAETPKDLFEKGKKFLRSPVSKKVYTDDKLLLQKSKISGLQALANKTMLNPPRHQIRAIKKDEQRLKEITLYNEEYLDNDAAYELELWNYNPDIFCSDDVVDIISLVASLQETKDERIQIEIQDLLEGYQW